MYISVGDFKLDNTEKVKLEGNYEIKTIANEAGGNTEELLEHQNELGLMVYVLGNVLYRTDTEGIEGLIKLFIRYTHDPCSDLNLDRSVKSTKVFACGTICPHKSVLFAYKSKIFVGFGRYFFGCKPHLNMKRISGDVDSGMNSDDDEYQEVEEKEDKITEDEIILNNPEQNANNDEYVHAFMIYDQQQKTLDAVGLYR